MKRIITKLTIKFGLLFALIGMLNGCAMVQSPVTGFAYTNVRAPISVSQSDDKPSRVGRASVRSILGLIALGDASIQAAAEKGGITDIHHVDYEATSYFGIMSEYTVVVYGD